MIINKGGLKRNTNPGGAGAISQQQQQQPPSFNGSINHNPIANSTVMSSTSTSIYNQQVDYGNNNNKYFLNDTDQYFTENSFQISQQDNQFFQPGNGQPYQQNGFFDMPIAQVPQATNFNNYQQQAPSNAFDNNQNNYFNSNMSQGVPTSIPPAQMNQQQMQSPFQPQYFNPLQNANNFLNDPVASMAVKYGSTLADQGKEYVSQNVDRWFSISKLKHYFAVDTSYVAKKLMIILFPFLNRDWSIKYYTSQLESVPPKLDVNAPDMYIPIMAYVTYLLMVGLTLGTQNKFSPEVLGLQASSSLGWLLIEVLVIFISLQVLNVKSLKTFDIISFCGYKYFGMILCLIGYLVVSKDAYNIVLIYMCVSTTYFMVRNLKLMILITTNPNDEANQYGNTAHGNKRRIYVLLFISLLQPFFMWLLTHRLVR